MFKKSFTVLSAALLALVLSFSVFAAKVNINTADAETLAAGISGVGPKLASAIVDYRQKHGPFESVDALQNVKGIGPSIVTNNRDDLTIKASSE